MNRDDLMYLAGLFDGEGSFSIQVQIKEYKGVKSPNFGPKMTMTLKYGWENPLKLLQSTFGGVIYDYTDGMHRWNLGTRVELIEAAEAIRPFLRIKPDICDNFLKALYMFPVTRSAHSRGERSWTPELSAAVTRIALTLNPETARKSPKTLEYLQEIEGIYALDQKVDAVVTKGD